jgi:hypothetical protein
MSHNIYFPTNLLIYVSFSTDLRLSRGHLKTQVNWASFGQPKEVFMSFNVSGTAITTWKTAVVGAQTDYKAALLKEKFLLDAAIFDLLDHHRIELEQEERRLPLTVITLRDLGCDEMGMDIKKIARRAHAAGLKMCPPEAAFALRLTYLDQPLGEHLFMCMRPIRTRLPYRCILEIYHEVSGMWLDATSAADIWFPPHRFVFAQSA